MGDRVLVPWVTILRLVNSDDDTKDWNIPTGVKYPLEAVKGSKYFGLNNGGGCGCTSSRDGRGHGYDPTDIQRLLSTRIPII